MAGVACRTGADAGVLGYLRLESARLPPDRSPAGAFSASTGSRSKCPVGKWNGRSNSPGTGRRRSSCGWQAPGLDETDATANPTNTAERERMPSALESPAGAPTGRPAASLHTPVTMVQDTGRGDATSNAGCGRGGTGRSDRTPYLHCQPPVCQNNRWLLEVRTRGWRHATEGYIRSDRIGGTWVWEIILWAIA